MEPDAAMRDESVDAGGSVGAVQPDAAAAQAEPERTQRVGGPGWDVSRLAAPTAARLVEDRARDIPGRILLARHDGEGSGGRRPLRTSDSDRHSGDARVP